MTKPSGRRPRRRHTPTEPRRIVRVLTEGEITEPDYLTEWARLNRHTVRLDLSDYGMTPDALVGRARVYARRNPQSRRVDRDFDEIWCVFDTDEHKKLAQAIEEARQSGIEVAVSNPCIELWLVLHARDRTAHIHRHDVQSLSNKLGLTDGKKIVDAARETLVVGFETAKQRARALDARHAGNGSPPRSNPSTDVWRLVDRLNGDP